VKILFIGAHFDDIEIGCGGTVARIADKGHEIEALVVTHSGYCDENGNVVREKDVAAIEGMAGLSMLGVSTVSELGLNTGQVEYGLTLIHLMESFLKRCKPDIVFTHWVNDVHQDHSAIGRATLNVCRKSSSVLMYRSNWYRGVQNFNPRIFVDTEQYFKKKEKAILCHQSEVTKFGKDWLRFIEAQDAAVGIEFGVKYAEAFEVVKLNISDFF
jgi:LmbE family N-acetylglucosaminyl deacetylase